MNITLSARDLATLRIGKRGPAFVDLFRHGSGVVIDASNGHTVSIVAAGDCDRAVRMPFDAFVRAAKLGGREGFSLDAKTCTAGGYRFPITLSTPDAPSQVPSETLLTLDEATVAKVIARIVPAMSDDDSRPHIMSMHLHRRAGVLAAEATNGHILAAMTTPSAGRDFDVMVPADALRSVARMKGDIAMYIERFPTIPDVTTRLLFARGTSTVACMGVANSGMNGLKTLPSIQFPDVVVCIPTTWLTSVTVDAAELRRVVTRLGKHGRSDGFNGTAVRMETRDGLALSTSADHDGGRLTAPTIPCEGTMNRAVSVQARYLLATCGTKGPVTFRFSGDMDPVRVENDGVVCVAMPVRE